MPAAFPVYLSSEGQFVGIAVSLQPRLERRSGTFYLQAIVVRDILNHAVIGRRSVASSVTLVVRTFGDLVSPFLDHVETLGVPYVSLQPDVPALSTIILVEQISRSATVLPGRPFALWR